MALDFIYFLGLTYLLLLDYYGAAQVFVNSGNIQDKAKSRGVWSNFPVKFLKFLYS